MPIVEVNLKYKQTKGVHRLCNIASPFERHLETFEDDKEANFVEHAGEVVEEAVKDRGC